MNRTDRLLAIVLELQAAGWQRAEDLAARFEITKRTVYRDIQALSEAGVPIVAVPGQGYRLAEGYFLPPLAFTPDEAIMLLLGGDFVAQNFDADYRAAVQAASRKIEAVLPEKRRAQVREFQRAIRFIAGATGTGATGTGAAGAGGAGTGAAGTGAAGAGGAAAGGAAAGGAPNAARADEARSGDQPRNGDEPRSVEQRWLPTVRRAILEHRTVRFQYHARDSADTVSGGQPRNGELAPAGRPRQADPYGLAHVSGAWYLVGYCHLRRDLRHFRLDRMEALALLDKTFERPATFQLDQGQTTDDRPIVVRALFAASVARWVREERSFFTVHEETRPDGLLLTFRVRHERDLLHWLLGWGSQVQVLEPAALRAQIAREAEALLRHHRPV